MFHELNATYCRQWGEQECSSCCWWGSPQRRRICHHLTSEHALWSAPSGHARAAGVSRWLALFLLSASCRWALCHYHGNSGGWSTRCTPGPRRPSSECKVWTLELMRTEDKVVMSSTQKVKHEKHFEHWLVNMAAEKQSNAKSGSDVMCKQTVFRILGMIDGWKSL